MHQPGIYDAGILLFGLLCALGEDCLWIVMTYKLQPAKN